MKLHIGPWMVLGYFILYLKSLGLVSGYFSTLPYSLNINPIDARGAVASSYIKVTGYYD